MFESFIVHKKIHSYIINYFGGLKMKINYFGGSKMKKLFATLACVTTLATTSIMSLPASAISGWDNNGNYHNYMYSKSYVTTDTNGCSEPKFFKIYDSDGDEVGQLKCESWWGVIHNREQAGSVGSITGVYYDAIVDAKYCSWSETKRSSSSFTGKVQGGDYNRFYAYVYVD